MVIRSAALLASVVALSLAQPALGQLAERAEAAFGHTVAPASPRLVTDEAAFIAQYDDGEADLFVSSGATTYEVAMLFDGVGGAEVTLGSVDVCWRSTTADTKIRYEVVVWAANGAGGTPGTELAKFAAVATGVGSTAAFYSTNLNHPLSTANVFIGVRYNPVVDPGFSYCVDTDGIGPTPFQPGFRRLNEAGAWNTISSIGGASDYKALMVRAGLSTPGVVAESLVVPLFTVDTMNPAGTTTLFAVRNLTTGVVHADVAYRTRAGVLQRTDELTLVANETATVNVRDIAGLDVDGDGVARGYVEITTSGNADLTPVLAGDFFQVDVGNDFATGDQLVRHVEMCTKGSVRFLEFPLPGSGTRLTVWIANPRGVGAGDPASFTVQAYDENGVAVASTVVKTTLNTQEFDATTFSAESFGTLRFDFTNSARGIVYAEASVEGRFSVGVAGQCDELP